MKLPTTIINHPAVAKVTSGEDEGSDYRFYVWLKDGWSYKYGRNAGCQGCFFNTVRQFQDALPTKD